MTGYPVRSDCIYFETASHDILQAQNGAMEVAKLQQKAVSCALSGHKADKQKRAEACKKLMARLEGSSSFVFTGDTVRLSA